MEQIQECKVIPLFNRKNNNKFMTPHELAQEYGIGINKSYELVNCKSFPVIKNGNRYLIIRDRVDQWFMDNVGLQF
jgi:excisionase family DNA binding protein